MERDISLQGNAEQPEQVVLWIAIQKIQVNVQHKKNILIIHCCN